MYLQSNNVLVSNTSYVSLNSISVTTNGYIEIPDGPTFSVNVGNAAFVEYKNSGVSINNAMWSWWTKPLVLRDVNQNNNWTYSCFTQSNGAVGIAITDNKTGNTNQYTLTTANTFSPDDHNASAICAGNNKVAIFIQGRVANSAVLNPNNMFYIQWDEGTVPLPGNLVNITFSTANTATASFYPNAFNSNSKFILIGRQQQENTANQWIYTRGTWPLSNFSAPQGFFRSTYSWPYIALRRSPRSPAVINFAVGWHPTDSNSPRNIYYGNIYANTVSTTPWDVYANNGVIANMTTGNNLPISETNLELVYTNPSGNTGNNTTRLFDVADGAIAFGSWDRNLSIIEYKMAYRARADLWLVYTICTGGYPFHGVGVRDYFGGMSIGGTDKFQITVSVNSSQKWEIREYQIPSATYYYQDPTSGAFISFQIPVPDTQWVLRNVIRMQPNEVSGRPMAEVASEDTLLRSSFANIADTEFATLYWRGSYDGSDFTRFSTNIESSRYRTLGPGISNTLIDTSQRANFSYVNVAYGGYIEVLSQSTGNNGYSMSGVVSTPQFSDVIDRFPFATDTNAISVGNLSRARRGLAGQTSYTRGYASGGFVTPPTVDYGGIDRFTFASTTPATTIGGLSARGLTVGVSSSEFGYTAGGYLLSTTAASNVIDKFPFAVDSLSASYVASLSTARYGISSQKSSTNGYISGGATPTVVSTIEKFLFSSDSNANILGSMSLAKQFTAGQSSSTNGYISGGNNPTVTQTSEIEKFPFATDSGSVTVANLTVARYGLMAQSSTTNGYNSGGTNSTSPFLNTIDKFPFATDTNATSVGNLAQSRYGGAGIQS